MKQRINYIMQEFSVFIVYSTIFFFCLCLFNGKLLQNIGLSLILGVFAKLIDSINRK